MSLSHFLLLVAVAGSIGIALRGAPRGAGIVALAVSALEALLAFGYLTLGLKGIPLALILGAALAISGGICYARSKDKIAVAGATLVTLVGLIEVMNATKVPFGLG